MNSLDEVSFKLGELNNGQKGLFARVGKQENELAAIRQLLTDIDAKLNPVVTDVVTMKPHVEHYAGVRKRAAWVQSIVIGIAGITGGSITTYVLKKFGG